LEEATQAIGKLDGLTFVLPNSAVFIYYYVRKEAVLSSQIEGTQSSLSDLLLFEMEDTPTAPIEDVLETSQYVSAMLHGLDRLKGGMPLSLRLIREIHGILLAKGRGSEKSPGEFRTSQNWIGGTRPGNALFVPPPPEHVMECMGQLELFLHEQRTDLPVILQAGLMHVQFETIHPFLDGNGRIGRLLITFLLCAESRLREPLLYLSLYLKTHRDTYYELLMQVRKNGDWEAWLEFFLVGVRDTAQQAVETAQRILALFESDATRLHTLGRASGSAVRIHQLLQRSPVVSMSAMQKVGLSFPAVASTVARLEKLGLMREITGRQRGRLYVYSDYLDILKEGTEPLPPT
jgi:Fic family protein